MKIFITLTTALAFSAFALAQEPMRLGLQQAVELSLDQNRELTISRLGVNSAQSGVREARGNLLPSLDMSGQYTRNLQRPVIFLPPGSPFGEVMEIGSDNSYTGTLQATVPIFAAPILRGVRMAEANLNMAREGERESRVNVIADVKQSYYNALIAREAMMVIEATFENARQNYKQINLLFREGVASEFDAIRAQVQVEGIRPQLDQAADNYQSALDMLKISIGLNVRTQIELSDSLLLAPVVNYDEALAQLNQLQESNPTLRMLQQQQHLAQHQVGMARDNRLPMLSAFGNYQMQAQANDFNFGDYNWVNTSLVGIQLRVPIFNGLTSNRRIEQAEISVQQLQLQEQLLHDAVQMQGTTYINRMQQALARYQAQELAMQLAERGLSIAHTRYNSDVGTLLELNDAELAYTQARLNYLQAIADYNLAYIEFERITASGLN